MAAFEPDDEQIDSSLEHWIFIGLPTTSQRAPGLLSIIGKAAYEVLRSLVAPEWPQTKTFDELVTTLQLTTRQTLRDR